MVQKKETALFTCVRKTPVALNFLPVYDYSDILYINAPEQWLHMFISVNSNLLTKPTYGPFETLLYLNF